MNGHYLRKLGHHSTVYRQMTAPLHLQFGFSTIRNCSQPGAFDFIPLDFGGEATHHSNKLHTDKSEVRFNLWS